MMKYYHQVQNKKKIQNTLTIKAQKVHQKILLKVKMIKKIYIMNRGLRKMKNIKL